MALTPANIVWYGPMTVAFKTGASATKTLTNLNNDSVTWAVETKTGNVVFEDGTEQTYIEGRKLTATITFSELVMADLDGLEGCDNILITLDNTKTITIAATCTCIASIDNGKTVVTVEKTAASGSTFASGIGITLA